MPINKQIETYAEATAVRLPNRYAAAIFSANSGALTVTMNDGTGTYRVVTDNAGADVSITTTANEWTTLNPAIFKGLTDIKFSYATGSAAYKLLTVSD